MCDTKSRLVKAHLPQSLVDILLLVAETFEGGIATLQPVTGCFELTCCKHIHLLIHSRHQLIDFL